jgi:uncharacterized protein (DUF1697 family)
VARYVALLRAINVGGRIVKMDRLRALFEEMGYRNVETLIASGNVLFDSTARTSAPIEKKIEQHLFEALGYDVETFVRTPAELAAVSALEPFSDSVEHSKATALYVGFVKAPPTKDACARLMSLGNGIDEFRVHGREYFWSSLRSMGQSKITGAAIERALKVPSTMRNITTIRRLGGGGG